MTDQGTAPSSATHGGGPPVVCRRSGRLGHVELDRPAAINALTHEMVELVHGALDAWQDDPGVEVVVVSGAGERGLCAGGDIVTVARSVREGGPGGEAFWRDEYRLNARIGEYPVPVVALMDGFVLGGGVGLSGHASHRVVTERSAVGMPETGIGFVPDVGGSLLLARAPGELGTHLALTASRVGAADAIGIGLADVLVPSDRLPVLVELLATTPVEEALARVVEPAPDSALLAERAWIDDAYRGDDLAEILERLDAVRPDVADQVRRNSPTACAVTLQALRRAADLDLRGALEQELRLTVRQQRHPDFVEGVRAQLVDKDRRPQWHPATAADVDPGEVEARFAPLPHPLFDGADDAARQG